LSQSDSTLIATSLFLGAAALLAPWVAEWLKRRWYAPQLEIDFRLAAPHCHLTRRGDKTLVYYFRFRVTNSGRSQARLCEAVLEGIETADASDTYRREENFSPIPLTWAGIGAGYQNINPGRSLFCDLGHISEAAFQQQKEPSKFVGITPEQQNTLKLRFDTPFVFFAQWDSLVPGKHRVTVAVFSENAPPARRTFNVAWSGKWQATEQAMYKEIVIS
jgi:hypothetical protein